MLMTFKIQDYTGHSTEVYDAATPEGLAAAKAKFAELVGEKKYTAATKESADVKGYDTVKKFEDLKAHSTLIPHLVSG